MFKALGAGLLLGAPGSGLGGLSEGSGQGFCRGGLTTGSFCLPLQDAEGAALAQGRF